MPQKTIRCRLIAPEVTRQAIWQLMAERNTPMVNETLLQLSGHPDFPKWQQKGKLPDVAVKRIIDTLKADPRFSGQPVWYYISAQKQVTYTFRSWLTLQKRKQWRLEGKRLWLDILRSDMELADEANSSLEAVQEEAVNILHTIEGLDLFPALMNQYHSETGALKKSALAYLLKRGGDIDGEENLEKLRQRLRKTEHQVRRLKQQIQASLPKGRDLVGASQTAALEQVRGSMAFPANDEEYVAWKDALTREPAQFPFPIIYETSECLTWSRDEAGKALVSFSGLGCHIFKAYFDKPHRHWFERFVEDQETKRASKHQHSAGLFTLRAAKLTWVPSKKHRNASEPWNRYYLNLHCTVDSRLWTQEGTQAVIQEKAASTAKKLESMRQKDTLSKTQQGYVRRLESTIEKLQIPYPRPSRTLYKGKDHILVGVSMGLDKPATVAVVDVSTEEVLAYRSLKQLLGKENYRLLQRARTDKARSTHEGHKQRRKGGTNLSKESNLGKEVDRLLAKPIVELAKEYQAGSIVLPDLAYIREVVEAEVKVRAEDRVPDYLDGQKSYAKAYRAQVHRWSYGRLQTAITSKAEQSGIIIETAKQGFSGTQQDKARDLALLGYEKRLRGMVESQ